MAILESVKKLASKVGADTNGRTIAEQINNINRHLDSTGSRDIAEAVSKFADKEDGTAILITKTVTENKTYKASDDGASGYSSVTVNVAAPTPETFEVNIVTDPQSYVTPDKTYAETIAAYNNGATLRINMTVQSSGIEPFTLTNLDCAVYDGTIMLFFDTEEQFGVPHIMYFIWSNPEIYVNEWVIGDKERGKL